MKILLAIFVSTVIQLSCFSQRQKFDCYNISKSKVLIKYDQLRGYGLEIKKSGNGNTIDFMKEMLLTFSYEELRQLCIDSWGVVNSNGVDNCYLKFNKSYSNISKSVYMEDFDYIEMFVMLNGLIKAKL